jgi:hypothetical protein
MPPNFYLTPKSLRHLQRHFGNGTMAGSYFLAGTFQTSDDLLAFLENAEPVSITKQTATNSVFLYVLTDGRMAGTVGIAKRNSFSADNLSLELRDGFQIEVGLVEELTFTTDFYIIARQTSKGYSIITAFPGRFARPFARKGQPANEYELNKQFWEDHVLLKVKS